MRAGNLRTLCRLAMTGGLLACVALGASPVRASYGHQDPGLTPCGDGSHAITLFRSYYSRDSSGLIWGLVEVRYSSYCNSIWTRVTNLRGSGTGYAPAASLNVDATIKVFNCPLSACLVDTATDTNMSLPSKNSAGWSLQVDLAAGANKGAPASKQPPAFRALATLRAGTSQITFDMGVEPIWDQLDNGFQRNGPQYRMNDVTLTCQNGISRCASWGETSAGGYRTIAYYLDSSLDYPKHVSAGVSVKADFRTLIGYWNLAAAHDPTFVECTGGLPLCLLAPVTVVLLDDADQRVAGKFAVTVPDGVWDCSSGPPSSDVKCGPTLALATHRSIFLNNDLDTFTHGCSDSDTGCTGSDSRKLITHELGHLEGLGECDMGFGTICAVTASGRDDMASGPGYFRPQWTDKQGLAAAYP
jgi:hypothetical protein